MIANLSVDRLGMQSAGKDPIYRYLVSGIRSTICLREVLSMANNFSLGPLTHEFLTVQSR